MTLRIFILLSFLSGLAWAEPDSAPIKNQTLHTVNFTTGEVEDLNTLEKGKNNVVIFMSSQCHCSKSHKDHIKGLQTQFPNIHFVIVDSNVDEKLDVAHDYFADMGVPVIQDQNFAIADAFKAYKTPHSFIVDPEGHIVYSGGVTDTNDFGHAQHFYLKDALTAVQQNKKPPLAYARALGCEIKR